MDLCSGGHIEEYATAACAPGTLGSLPIWGVPLDAYLCGSNRSGIDWRRSWWDKHAPVSDICSVRPDSAYQKDGYCGQWNTKQLVASFFRTVPLWGIDAALLNVPSLNCLLGLGNCDIHYCQTCAGRCGFA